MEKIRLVGDNILVKQKAPETKIGSFYLADIAVKKGPNRGEIVSLGEGVELKNGTYAPYEVKVGDTVIFGKYKVETIKEESGDIFFLMPSMNIEAIINKE